MTPGLQFRAPSGFGQLSKSRRYHVVAHDPVHDRVIVVYLTEKPRQADVAVLSVKRFRHGFEMGLLQRCDEDDRATLPPWLPAEPMSYFAEATSKSSAKTPVSEGDETQMFDPSTVAEEREERVQWILDKEAEVFANNDFAMAIKREARQNGWNESRTLQHVLLYLVFGKNKWALRSPPGGRGKYDRNATTKGKRRGRPHRNGQNHGHDVTPEMAEKIRDGFLKNASVGKQMNKVCADTLAYQFGCMEKKVGTKSVLYHPEGEPFPSTGQFRYWVVEKLFGHREAWTMLLGDRGYEARYPTPQGRYTENLVDLMETVSVDAQFGDVFPRSYFGNHPLGQMVVVEIVDNTSAAVVGIGFGVGGEATRIYEQALAISALPKSVLADLLGLDIAEVHLPGIYLARAWLSDRGAGGAKAVRDKAKAARYDPTFRLTPSYCPQSNSIAEAGHDRNPEIKGAPSYKVSDKRPVQMAADYVRIASGKNYSKEVCGRLPPEAAAAGVSNPMELWEFYESRGRQAGHQLPTAEVIRQLVPKVTFKIVKGLLTRNSIVYKSGELMKTKTFKHSFRHEGAELQGHAFDISNRIEWVLVDGMLVQVSPVYGLATQAASGALSLPEQEAYATAVLDSSSSAREQKLAVGVGNRQCSLETTGKRFADSKTVKGRPKIKKPDNRREIAALKN